MLLAVSNAILGMALGLFLSAFARTEFQAVQFMPAVVLPQILLCGLIVPRDQMARALEIASAFLPLTYAYDALHRVGLRHSRRPPGARRGIVLAATGAALALGAATLRRKTP